MKIALEYLREKIDIEDEVDESIIVNTMKAYALEVARESLNNASENAKVMTKNTDTGNELEVLSWTDSRNVKFSVSRHSILSETNIPQEVKQ